MLRIELTEGFSARSRNLAMGLGAFLAIGLGMMLNTGCAKKILPVESPAIIHPTVKNPPAVGPGSLWALKGQDRWSLVRDDTAHEVGDIITVLIVNNTSALGTAKTETKRNSEIEADILNFFGKETSIPRSETPIGGAIPPLIKSSSKSSFEGDGTTERSGSITGRVTCLVTYVYPNGNMRIYGNQAVSVNNEQTILTVEGVVRDSDLTWNNTVLSGQIANSRIEYTGRGVISDVQRTGWMMRGFAMLWPF